MLTLKIKPREILEEKTLSFTTIPEMEITMEHSLISVSKWEERYLKPFLSKEDKTREEWEFYYKCMTLTPKVPDHIYHLLSKQERKIIDDYIEKDRTASTVKIEKAEGSAVNNGMNITSELIYSWMCIHKINWEASKWHLSRLLILIQMVAEQKNPDGKNKKKRSTNQIATDYAALNRARRAKYGVKG